MFGFQKGKVLKWGRLLSWREQGKSRAGRNRFG